MSKIYIGIDIGLKGAISVIDNGKIINHKMPLVGGKLDVVSIYNILSGYNSNNTHTTFEDLGVIFGTSKATAFSMGRQLGILEGMCVALKLPYTKVKAKEWQKEMFKGIEEIKDSKGKRQTKKMAELAIKRIFPDLILNFEKSKIVSDGLVDAVLIAEWARRNNL